MSDEESNVIAKGKWILITLAAMVVTFGLVVLVNLLITPSQEQFSEYEEYEQEITLMPPPADTPPAKPSILISPPMATPREIQARDALAKYGEDVLAKESWSQLANLSKVDNYLQLLKARVSQASPETLPLPPTTQATIKSSVRFVEGRRQQSPRRQHYWSHKGQSLDDIAVYQRDLLTQLQAAIPSSPLTKANQTKARSPSVPTTPSTPSLNQLPARPAPLALDIANRPAMISTEHKTWLDIGFDIQGLEEQRRSILQTLATELEVEGPVLPAYILR